MKEVVEEIIKKLDSGLDDLIKQAFGRSLHELREYCQITLKDLAKETNIPFQSLSVYERGKASPTIVQAYRITSYFGLSIEDFIEYGTPTYGLYKNEYDSIIDLYEHEGDKQEF